MSGPTRQMYEPMFGPKIRALVPGTRYGGITVHTSGRLMTNGGEIPWEVSTQTILAGDCQRLDSGLTAAVWGSEAYTPTVAAACGGVAGRLTFPFSTRSSDATGSHSLPGSQVAMWIFRPGSSRPVPYKSQGSPLVAEMLDAESSGPAARPAAGITTSNKLVVRKKVRARMLMVHVGRLGHGRVSSDPSESSPFGPLRLPAILVANKGMDESCRGHRLAQSE